VKLETPQSRRPLGLSHQRRTSVRHRMAGTAGVSGLPRIRVKDLPKTSRPETCSTSSKVSHNTPTRLQSCAARSTPSAGAITCSSIWAARALRRVQKLYDSLPFRSHGRRELHHRSCRDAVSAKQLQSVEKLANEVIAEDRQSRFALPRRTKRAPGRPQEPATERDQLGD